MLLSALTTTLYDCPLVRPEITSGDAELAGLRVIHVVPPSMEYSKFVAPEVPPEGVRATES
jgi:hypothetical protein